MNIFFPVRPERRPEGSGAKDGGVSTSFTTLNANGVEVSSLHEWRPWRAVP